MKRFLTILLLISIAAITPAQGILGAAKEMSKRNQEVQAQELATNQQKTTSTPKEKLAKDTPFEEGSEILNELGITDDDTTSTPLPAKPAFQVPDTTMPLGWLPGKTSQLLNDYTGILTLDQASHIETRLLDCYDSSKVEIAVVVVPDLGGDAIESFCQNLWDKWHVGDKKKSNGVMIVIKPKNSTDGQVRIQTGYGMEGALPDAFCRRIIEDQMIPYFRENEYFEAIDAALDIIIPVAKGEYSQEKYDEDNSISSGAAIVIVLIIIIGFIALVIYGITRGGGSTSSGGYGSYGGGSPHSWSSGGSSWGGGGSSFGGFGGGFSGGGGASGRW